MAAWDQLLANDQCGCPFPLPGDHVLNALDPGRHDKHGAFGMSHDALGHAPYQSVLHAGATVGRNCDKIYFTFSTACADLIDRGPD